MKNLFLFTILVAGLCAATINIPADYDSIQEGIDAASDGDVVLVQPGVYAENINFHGKAITVGSLFLETGDHDYIQSTIIDGNQTGSVIVFSSGETNASVLKGMTVTNGFAFNGGGINCLNNSNPSIEYVIIKLNSAYYNGGGVHLSNSSPVFDGVTISDNGAGESGGGFYLNSSDAVITNSILWNNGPEEIYFYEHGEANSLFVRYCDLQGGPGDVETNDNGSMDFGNDNTNIDANPLFIAPGFNYELQVGSQCINAGDPDDALDSDGTVREMGAMHFAETFGCTDETAVNYDPGATNDDGSCEYAPIAEDLNVVINEDGNFTLILSATDPDGDDVSYSIWSIPSDGVAALTDSTLTYQPDPDFFGMDTLQYSATDSDQNTDIATISIVVLPINDPPSFAAPGVPDQFMDFNTSSSILLFADDPDGDTLYYYADSDNENLNITTAGNSLTLTPAQNWGSTVNVTVTVIDRNIEDPNYDPELDGQALSDVDEFVLTINLAGEYVSMSIGNVNYVNHTIDVMMDNQMDIAGFQFELMNANELSGALFTMTNAFEGLAEDYGFIVEFEPASLDHGSIIVGYAPPGMPDMPTGEGVLTTISYDAEGWVGPEICLQDITITRPDGLEANIFVGSCITYEFGQGDIVQDGHWNVLDIVQLIGIILEQNLDLSDYLVWSADINEDEQINVTDAVHLVNLVMGTPLPKTNPMTLAEVIEINGHVSITSDGWISGIELNYSGSPLLSSLMDQESALVEWSDSKLIILSLDGSNLAGKELLSITGSMEISRFIVSDVLGNSIRSNPKLTVTAAATEMPGLFSLSNAYPNPFNPSTTLAYNLAQDSAVELQIFNIRGELIHTLVSSSQQTQGSYHVTWNADNHPSGLYIARLVAGQYQDEIKLMLVK